MKQRYPVIGHNRGATIGSLIDQSFLNKSSRPLKKKSLASPYQASKARALDLNNSNQIQLIERTVNETRARFRQTLGDLSKDLVGDVSGSPGSSYRQVVRPH